MGNLTYFIITRKLFESSIWNSNPHILKLFIYLIGMARYKNNPKRFIGFEVKRGELVTSLSDIANGNEYLEYNKVKKWSRQRVSRMLSKLQESGHIKIVSDTYGTHIRVCNYNEYQNPGMYSSDSSVTAADSSVTAAYIYNKDNKVKKDKKEQIKIVLPEWLDIEIWKEYKKYRQNGKGKFTKYAQELAIKKLVELKADGNDPSEVLKQTILRGWTGLFPLRGNQNFNNEETLEEWTKRVSQS